MTVEIRTGNRSYTVSSAADVTSALDELAKVITTPTLIELRAAETVLHIGAGNPLASVALFLDAKRQTFFAEGDQIDTAVPDELSFDQNGVARHFYRGAAITPTEASTAAIDFVTGDGVKPPRLHWIAEGLPDAAR